MTTRKRERKIENIMTAQETYEKMVEYSSSLNNCCQYVDECVKEALLKYKENVCKNVTIPFFKGVYDCILEIENLNRSTRRRTKCLNYQKKNMFLNIIMN